MTPPIWHKCAVQKVSAYAAVPTIADAQYGVFVESLSIAAGECLIEERPLLSYVERPSDMSDNSESPTHGKGVDRIGATTYRSNGEIGAAVSAYGVGMQHGLDVQALRALYQHPVDLEYYKEKLLDLLTEGRMHFPPQYKIQELAHMLAAFQANAIGAGRGSALLQGYSRFNHSCSFDVRLMEQPSDLGRHGTLYIKNDLHAAEQIGRQLFTTYLGWDDLLEDAKHRKKCLENWHFNCQCNSCLHPEISDPRRRKLKEWKNAFAFAKIIRFDKSLHSISAEQELKLRPLIDRAVTAAKEEKLCAMLPCIYRSARTLCWQLARSAREVFDFVRELELVHEAEDFRIKTLNAFEQHLGANLKHDTPEGEVYRSTMQYEMKLYKDDAKWNGTAITNWKASVVAFLDLALDHHHSETQSRLERQLQCVGEAVACKGFTRDQKADMLYSGALCCMIAAKTASSEEARSHREAAKGLVENADKIHADHQTGTNHFRTRYHKEFPSAHPLFR